ncbi:50S ribosomal protein L7/L12 [Zavarzinella formosa]|uniref:50S ribosomal protein L7/L12 n=1 Tax=Zavarzinella formosa TaxID=360055 RepID=UPI000382B3FC|nr:50S ribosomal protein L7/L12 [Zavarzinella formosa]
MSDAALAPEVKELGDKIAHLTIIQAVALKEYLKQEYKIEPAAGGGGVVMQAGPAVEPEKKAESTEFNVILEAGFDAAKKIGIIKVVREITGQGLAEAKATVEGAPKPLKESVDKATAEKIKKSLEDAGAKVAIKGV